LNGRRLFYLLEIINKTRMGGFLANSVRVLWAEVHKLDSEVTGAPANLPGKRRHKAGRQKSGRTRHQTKPNDLSVMEHNSAWLKLDNQYIFV